MAQPPAVGLTTTDLPLFGDEPMPHHTGSPENERTVLVDPKAASPGATSQETDNDETQVNPAALAGLPPLTERASTSAGANGDAQHKPATGTLPGHSITGVPSQPVLSEAEGGGPQASFRQVGRYVVEARLGRGGMATVYRAQDPQIGRALAIKFLHAAMAEDEDCHARFLREARAAGGLQHPNIVAVYDVGEIEGRPYMAMELVEGAPLSDTLEKTKQMPARAAAAIALQLARALSYAHERGVVHRDIKPANIMLLADGKTAKVMDFGIAHIDDGGSQHTQVGAVLGTPQYMSPEQTRGEKLDGRSDLFSAGVVLYQMLTGERPFRGDSLIAIATKIASEAPTPLAQLRPDVPASLRRVVDRCLAKVPAQRFASGNDMADALAKVLAEMDEAEHEKSQPRTVPLRVKWALAMAAIVAVVMGITATIVTQKQYTALMGQATDYGASLARFIARQNAASALNEEWEVVDVALQEMMKTGTFERIVFIDKAGIVRAASMPALLGLPYKPAGTASHGKLAGDAAAHHYQVGAEPVLGFEAPVSFQNTPVGRIALGIAEKPLVQVAQLSITLMITLALVTVTAVALAMYFLANWFAKPIRLVSNSMKEIAKGNLTHRIGEQRKDEFGQLFADFDAMAQALQSRESAPPLAVDGAPVPVETQAQTPVQTQPEHPAQPAA